MAPTKPVEGTPPSAVSFAELMALERVDRTAHPEPGTAHQGPEVVELFRSLTLPFGPGGGDMAFGGHVYAQSAYAASKTVAKGFVLHNISGSFALPGVLDRLFIYSVRHVRDGSSYCLRSVDVRQGKGICFTCICSFKRNSEENLFSHQPPGDIGQTYRSVLQGKKIEDHPYAPGADAPFWTRGVREGDLVEPAFPGVDIRKVDMTSHNNTSAVRQHPDRYRQLQYYRLSGTPEIESETASIDEQRQRHADGEYDNLYACAHLYASDRNSLFVITSALDVAESFTAMASLNITVVIHAHGEAMRMVDAHDRRPHATGDRGDGAPLPAKWFIQEAWTSRSGENRGLHESRIWSPDGVLVATTVQDGMIKVKELIRQKL